MKVVVGHAVVKGTKTDFPNEGSKTYEDITLRQCLTHLKCSVWNNGFNFFIP